MKMLFKAVCAASVALGAVSAMPMVAQAQVVKGIGVADQRLAVFNSSAFQNARTQRPTTYKPQIDQANTFRQQVAAQLQPMVDKVNADAKAAKPDENSLRQQVAQIQGIEAQAQEQLNQILAPIALSEAYVLEQIEDQFDAAVKRAMAKRNISIVFDMNATMSHNAAYDMTADITAELNAVLPNAQLVPPPGWLPRAQREAQAAQAAAGAQPAAPAATTPAQPDGR